MTKTNRTGARTVAAVPADVLAKLHAGSEETVALVETLAMDFALLLKNLFPQTPAADLLGLQPGIGVTQRMQHAGSLLLRQQGEAVVEQLVSQTSDTARGWAAYVIAAIPGLELGERLQRLRPLAADAHFGVREWAWLALRPHVVDAPEAAIELLQPWTGERDANLRRFASEATRPRGVWCSHIGVLKEKPQLGLSLLQPLRADPERYVQDSVANWLNDAAKTRPDWVAELCRGWLAENPGKATAYICKRAQRSLK